MINEKMLSLGKKSSVIREIFEYGKKRKKEIGEENVFDFSLGNPSVECPDIVNKTLTELISSTPSVSLHGYTSAIGDLGAREAICNYINKKYDVNEKPENVYLTVGAAASLTISLNAVLNNGEEVIVFSPFFPEYRVFCEKAGGVLKESLCDTKTFQPDIENFKNIITEKTKAVIINSPNNPTGVIYTKENIKKICDILKEKEKEYGKEIFILSDEPYRELVYSDKEVVYIPKYYENTIICYSFSKSLSLPGERIGYIMVSEKCRNLRDVYFAICGSGRALGFVCAPALFQYMIPKCIGLTSDINIYKENRDILYNALNSYGYEVVYPDGAFYLFVKALEENASEFCEKAKKYELLLVPSDSFGVGGYVRISYCVSQQMIKKALPSFEKLSREYKEELK